ncbi:PucR family transcriptional regulator [Diaminobutyricibacter tongyongensis]|uniref:PucR family transcriptional regulator n=1 Tax=Leifsonia tongyongensis TaxID=1268043 RepID=A0A6L9XX80_9MICO|nr:helix-turn-helix domain-containing protein [Diaminobutyricibacter tongyongensis]NEN05886.1 PucR family transcriptional regulator [Diaminobutyricibacter tongyongensis]
MSAEQSQPPSLLPRLTANLLATADDLPGRLAETIRRRVPSYRQPSLVSDQELDDSCAAHVGFISSLGQPDPERDKTIRMIGASRARTNFPLPDVLDAIRVGSEFIWGEIVDHARSSGTASDAELVTVAGQVWSMSDEFVGLMSAGYREEQDFRLINGERLRYALCDTVLSGHDQPTATLWQAVDRLGLPRDRPFVVVAVEAQGDGEVPTPRVDKRLREDKMESAWLLRSDVELGIVSCFHDQIRVVRKALQGYEVRAGISPVTDDFGHTPQAVRLARTALAASDAGQVTFFSDSAINTMAAGAPDVASELAGIVLYRILELPDLERETILDTVRTWFSTGGSVAESARQLFLHPNTVRNRLRRLETLTNRSLSDPRQAAEVYLAVVSLPRRPVG